jgi:hypothetical protein
MKRRKFIKGAAVAPLSLGVLPGGQAKTPAYFELRVYQLKNRGAKVVMDAYLQQVFIPAALRQGIAKVGVFTELHFPEPPRLYVLLVHPSLDSVQNLDQALQKDAAYGQASQTYRQLLPEGMPYERVSTSLIAAFNGMPQWESPPQGSTIFELRNYESPSEDGLLRKIAMFDDEELPLFREIGLTPVFFGKDLAGKNLPCLTYLLAFPDMATRDKNWDVFARHPAWLAMRDLPKYAHTVSKVHKIFLVPTPYAVL